ncbi:LysR family transcriptional regulator [Kutzneria chonburiensis]|uniref:LysR family transcriptional regulator n=1 Tax=Kutzneria chonburiensis TaxID=1483604 RepID=A0ABV6MIV5_9PSEU|nr:LysR family transcriptional regulator [Kutzneria chonburiensis]
MPDAHELSSGLLRVFVEVARLGSFTAAGTRLGYTQSAISRQISALEDEAGTPLFDRLPRGVRPTEPGRRLLPHAEAVLDRLEAARRELADLRELATGRLRVGAFATADASLVPKAIAAFRAACPAVVVTLTEMYTPGLVGRLRDGELDVAILSGDGPFDGLDLRKLRDDTMLVALPAGHRLARRRRVRLIDLADEEWIAGSDRPEQTLISSCLANGFRPRIGFVARDWLAKQGFVAAGVGITLIPSIAAESVRPDIALVQLHPDEVPVRAVHAATPAGVALSPATRAFLDIVND